MVDKSIAITGLLAALTPDSRVYLLERRRSRSNTTRGIDVVIVDDEGAIQSIGADVATFADLPWTQDYQSAEVRGSRAEVEALIDGIGVELYGLDYKWRIAWL